MVHLGHMTVRRNNFFCSASGLNSKDGHRLRDISWKSRSRGTIATRGLGCALCSLSGERVSSEIYLERLERRLKRGRRIGATGMENEVQTT